MIKIFALVAAAYLLGSVPFGFIVARLRGVDLRQVGSGNIGATNVYRALGLRVALFVFVLDVAKGFIGTRLFPVLWQADLPHDYARVLCGIAAIAGAVATVFMRFRGGKGVATAVGVFLGLQPLATAICIGVWAGLFAVYRYVSLGSICGAVTLPVLVALMNRSGFTRDPVFYMALLVAAIVVIRHKSNIQRLVGGTENRIGRTGG
jgi:glycerol-3-phosphate acyltransferase PlsY